MLTLYWPEYLLLDYKMWLNYDVCSSLLNFHFNCNTCMNKSAFIKRSTQKNRVILNEYLWNRGHLFCLKRMCTTLECVGLLFCNHDFLFFSALSSCKLRSHCCRPGLLEVRQAHKNYLHEKKMYEEVLYFKWKELKYLILLGYRCVDLTAIVSVYFMVWHFR